MNMLNRQAFRLMTLSAVIAISIPTANVHAQCDTPVEIDKLLAPDQIAHSNYGNAVAIDGEVAIVGRYKDSDNGIQSGSAFVYRFDGTHWVQEAKLTASEGDPGDWFGDSVDIQGDTAVVGAPRDFGAAATSGSVYVYNYNGTHWIETQKLMPSDALEGDSFGESVSISYDRLLIGAEQCDDNGFGSGAAYVFAHDTNQWLEVTKLLASDGRSSDLFGKSVALAGNTAIIGAEGDDDHGFWSGAAYLFKTDGTLWSQIGKLVPTDGEAGDIFGSAVAITANAGVDGDTVVIGAFNDDDNGVDSGSAYIYELDRFLWVLQDKIYAFDGSPGDWFGESVAISGDRVLVGSPFDDSQNLVTGSAYLFERAGSNWNNTYKLTASDEPFGSYFGDSVAISADAAIIGKPQAYNGAIVTGAAYTFDLSPAIPPCPADLNSDCALNFFDVSIFLQAFTAQDLLADFTNDGLLNFFDVSAFLSVFSAGCP